MEMTYEEAWNALKKHLIEAAKWEQSMQRKPGADCFFYFLREGYTRDTIALMQYFEGKNTPETRTLLALLGDPNATLTR